MRFLGARQLTNGTSRWAIELAKKDPSGKRTSGIIRTKTSYDFFNENTDEAKSKITGGKDPWNTKKYLNICS